MLKLLYTIYSHRYNTNLAKDLSEHIILSLAYDYVVCFGLGSNPRSHE